MTAIFQITKSTQHILDAWQQKARGDATVWPYLSFDPHNPAMSCDDGDDWKLVYWIDESASGVLSFSPDRGRGNRDAGVSIWVLDVPSKRRISGLLLRELPALARRYGVQFLKASCHVSNLDSVKILRRRFGEPWGRCQSNGWNGLTGQWDDTLHFKISVEEYGKAMRK